MSTNKSDVICVLISLKTSIIICYISQLLIYQVVKRRFLFEIIAVDVNIISILCKTSIVAY